MYMYMYMYVSTPARSVKLQIVYWLKMNKTAALNTFTIKLLHVYVLRVWMVAILSRGGGVGPK